MDAALRTRHCPKSQDRDRDSRDPRSKTKTKTKTLRFQDQDRDQDSRVPRLRPRPRLVRKGLETSRDQDSSLENSKSAFHSRKVGKRRTKCLESAVCRHGCRPNKRLALKEDHVCRDSRNSCIVGGKLAASIDIIQRLCIFGLYGAIQMLLLLLFIINIGGIRPIGALRKQNLQSADPLFQLFHIGCFLSFTFQKIFLV